MRYNNINGKLKNSKYNTSIVQDNNLIIFNALTKKIGKIKNFSDIESIYYKDINLLDNDLKKKLYSRGFIVEDKDNEDDKCLVRLNELIMEKKLVITVLCTGQCNFRCKYCYEDFNKPKMDKETCDALICYIKKNISSYTSVQLRWFGGEPLLALDVIEYISTKVIQICDEYRRVYSAEILTNGYLLDWKTFKFLEKLKVTKFKVTLDGVNYAHDSQRVLINGGKTFDKIWKNIIDIKNSLSNENSIIMIRTNISKNTIKDIHKITKLFYENFNSDKRFCFRFNPVDQLSNLENNLVLEKKSDIVKELISSPFKLNYDPYYDMLKGGLCRASKRYNFVIDSTGIIYKCLVYFDQDDNIIGNIDNNGDMKINYRKLAKWVNIDNSWLKCQECSNKPRCNAGKCVGKRLFEQKLGCKLDVKDTENILRLLTFNQGTKTVESMN